ncbi:hypothetical protein THAOC_30754 [Thalassiosira oceanica]|uniref:Uncharacterized protein n=1 Tax=Thalassiosira oceanica TaxID=159749 RepID=K0RDF5_THAOC|nr:hypothetical protein THAOC_30754 [Thalassiosira oceanica]|eukprot:EJK50304.1 hypothetical protein THAOC_30754 [Thalassiosira oceanica]
MGGNGEGRSPIGYARASMENNGSETMLVGDVKTTFPTVNLGNEHNAEALLIAIDEAASAREYVNSGQAANAQIAGGGERRPAATSSVIGKSE